MYFRSVDFIRGEIVILQLFPFQDVSCDQKMMQYITGIFGKIKLQFLPALVECGLVSNCTLRALFYTKQHVLGIISWKNCPLELSFNSQTKYY